MIIINNIENILKVYNIPIKKMANELGENYETIYSLVKREYLDTTQFVKIVKIARYLDVDINLLFTHKEDIMTNKNIDSEEMQKLVNEAVKLQKNIKKAKSWNNEQYMKKMISTIYNLRDAYTRNDKMKFVDTLMKLYENIQELIPNEIQKSIISNEDNWNNYAIAFVTGLISEK